MSAVTDRLTPADQDAIARIIFTVRARIAAEAAAAQDPDADHGDDRPERRPGQARGDPAVSLKPGRPLFDSSAATSQQQRRSMAVRVTRGAVRDGEPR